MTLAYAVSVEPTAFEAVAYGDLADACYTLGRLGYDAVELAVRDPAAVSVASLREIGLPVVALGTGQAYLAEGLSLSSADEEVRRGAVNRLRAHVRLAADVGALVIVGLVRGRAGSDPRARERLLESLRESARGAEAAGVRLALEPINRYETDLLPTVDAALDLADAVASDALGIVADTFHMNIEEQNPFAAVRRAGDRLWHLHLADTNRLAPGWGHLDLVRLFDTLREIGYQGAISAEVRPEPSFEAAARQTAQTVRAVLGVRRSAG